MTLMLAGRMMTLAFIGQAGSGLEGAPPAGWLMPLVGDAVIGLAAPVIAVLIWTGRGRAALVAITVFHALGIWDALSAWLVHYSVPWPEFFMIQIFGWTMFPMAAVMHAIAAVLVWLAWRIRA
ncbi:MAG: hypothetical protein AB8H79_19390 [Myxococcota bacterium]